MRALPQEFVKAVIAYQRKVTNSSAPVARGLKMNQEMEKKRKIIVRSFSLARDMYDSKVALPPSEEPGLEEGAEFLEVINSRCCKHNMLRLGS